jgi:hypothetical protein
MAPVPTGRWQRWQDWANLILGIWLFISPWILGLISPRSGSVGDFWWVGAFIFLLALWSLGMRGPVVAEWLIVLLAIWLFISPWVLGFSHVPRAAWNAWIFGVIAFFLALSALSLIRPRRPIGRPAGYADQPADRLP